ncbi:EF-hand calcium-binding domain-containing protein 6 isoform X1 [Megalobrama amblycephala]|uniref:EF-hand calcium-binding domain-containing protein 6 isoform X1 n=2 Tax=Megalobrama amblycephala TaxID=75352 RepID=UPI0020147AC4|nr:EF-hand calcium-binding domain-containing protein 6 isoform X1 [Megalobrama amblycephala]
MRPRSAVESWVSPSAEMHQISGHIDLRPITQGLTIIPRVKSSSRTSTGDFSRRNTLKSDSASSVQSVADENLSLVDIENVLLERVKDRKDDLKVAFEAFDQEGNKTVTKGEFRRVIEGFLVPLTESQFEGLLAELDLRENGTIPYMEFLRRYCKVSSAVGRISSRSGSYSNLSLGELQCRLKDKIGGNLKNITRAFRLFDYNSDGHIQRHELRKVLEGYCFPMSQLEFHRLWSHYSVNNADTISYKDFLEQLGVDCENYRKIAPDSIQLALNWDAVSRTTTRPKSKTSVRAFSGKSRDTLDEAQIRFLSKIKKNHRLVEKALQAFDITDSGFVSQENLRSVLSNFLFPMDDNIFRELLNRFGVSSTEPVQWRIFLGLFKDDITAQKESPPATPETCSIEAILARLRRHVLNHPLVTEAFLDFDKNRTGFISRDELCRALESLDLHLTVEQFTALADVLDVEHTDVINYQQFLDFLHHQRPIEQTPKLNIKAPAWVNTLPSTATTTWNAVEGILMEKLSENYDMLIESIINTTQNQSDIIPLEDLRRLIQQHGLPLSEHHFSKLCKPFLEGGGVNYKLFLTSLGVPERNEGIQINEREEKKHEACMLNIKAQAVKDVVLKKLKDRFQRHGMTLQDYLMSTRKSSTAALTLRDFCKILDDCGIFLEGLQFQMLIESLGFNLGPISVTDFVAKFEEVTKPEKDKDKPTKNMQTSTLLTAEDCLGQLKKRIKEYHGDALTAFRLMDKNRDGLVNRIDFRSLFDSLMFVTQEREYQRLLDLLGLTPGATLNYTDFYKKVLSSGKMKSHHHDNTLGDGCLDIACDQVHDYLAAIVHKRSSELSKAFCQLGDDGESIMTKNDLKQLLFKYSMPITPNEFEKLWHRYDEEGKGFLTQTAFLRKFKATSDEDSQSDALQEQLTEISTTPDLEVMLQNLRKWIGSDFESVSGSLVVLDKNKDGYVTVTDLLSLLRRHGFQLTETQLTCLLNLLGFEACLKELPYLDFLKHLAGPPVSSGTAVDPPQSSPMGSPEPVEDVEELSPERAIQRVKELITASSDTLYKAFSAFDKTGDGMITQTEFRQVLDHFCMCLSDVQFRKLLSEMRLSEGEEIMIDWREFLQVFNLHTQETADEWLKKIHKMRFPNQTRPLVISDILRRVQEVVSARIYTITKEMVDLDYANINTISKMDFKTICDRHFMRLTDDQFQNLWKMLPVNGFGNLEYREFLKKFSGEQKGLEKVAKSLPGSARSTLERPASLRRPKTAPCTFTRSTSSVSERLQRPSTASRRSTPLLNCEDVEMKVRSRIQDCWRHIQRRCRQADPERTGEIDVDIFLEILQGLHIDLSPPEFKQLAVKYDIKNSGRLSYPDFLRHFVLMFSPQLNTSSSRLKLQLPTTPMSPGPLSGECVEAMLRISRPIQLFWRQMRQKFTSFDKERTGKISLQDFRKVLRQYSMNLSEEEFFHFTSFFDSNLSGRISYNDFLRIFLK